MGAIRNAIISAARDELSKQNLPPGPNGPISQHPSKRYKENDVETRGGWKRLEDIFANAVMGFSGAGDPSFKKWGLHNEKPLGKEWCGIFDTHILRRASVDVKWNLSNGRMEGSSIRLLTTWGRDDIKNIGASVRSAENLYIEPGDVITLQGSTNHHCLVVGIDDSRRSFSTIEGNTAYQEISSATRKASELTTIYKVITDTRFPPSVFDPVVKVPATFLGTMPSNWRVTDNASTWYYRFSSNNTVDYGNEPGVTEGSGQWFAAGGSFLKIAWKTSGSIELWDWSRLGDDGSVKSKYFYKGDPMVTLTATKQ
jgi:hypothetical protein